MSTVFENISLFNHEQVVFCNDPLSGLKAIIAVHNTKLGPGLGGCRFYNYATEADALNDVLRLSKGMTYKSAVSGLNFGGAKAVIIGDPSKLSSELLFRTYGRFVQTLNGRYITCEDVGTNPDVMEWIRIETRHVLGLPVHLGGLGDPSPITAYGTFIGIKASLKKLTGREDLTNVKIAIQGAGHVGYHLCKELHKTGAKIYATDLNTEALNRVIQEFGVTAVKPDRIYSQKADIFAPCAMGGIINDQVISQLNCSIVAGAANNPLEDEEKHSQALQEKGILYAPDYVINAGGLIDAASEFFRVRHKEYVMIKTEEIYQRLLDIYTIAEDKKISTAAAAQQIAEKRIYSMTQCKNLYARRDKTVQGKR